MKRKLVILGFVFHVTWPSEVAGQGGRNGTEKPENEKTDGVAS